ncbi:MAG: AlwI family type II restriction endonuclease [Streptococcus salivarius]
MAKYSYTSFIWKFGNTTFRQSSLPLKLELGCRALQNVRLKHPTTEWNSLYSNFMDEMNAFDIINFGGTLPDKDSRAISSFIQQLGLCNDERYLSSVGEKVLELSKTHKVQKNELNISEFGYLYFLQLLKKSYTFKKKYTINPFIATLVTLIKNDGISEEEFKFFVMTTIDNTKILEISKTIKKYRESSNQQQFIYDYIINLLFSMDNYKKMYQDFVINNSVIDTEIRYLGVNTNGPNFEIPIEKLYFLLRNCNDGISKPTFQQITDILTTLSSGKKSGWKKLLFGESAKRSKQQEFFKELLVKLSKISKKEFREWFLYNWHFIKTEITLKDYFDLNKRVLSATELFSFSKDVNLTLFSKAYFQDKIDNLLDCTTKSSSVSIYDYTPLSELFDGVLVTETSLIYKKLSQLLKTKVNKDNINSILNEINNRNFKKVINTKFSKDRVIQILDDIKTQYSTNKSKKIKKYQNKIQSAVSKDANTPTIFEYITAIAWYYISEKEIQPLNSMNLTLDADFLPKTHATGGQSDLIFEYRNYQNLPDHDFILEVTLNKDTNQRRAEMEPVSRHLGEYKIKHQGRQVFCAFLAHKLDKNTVIHFRQQKITPYYYQDKWAEDNMIIPLVIDNVIYALRNNKTYSNLYQLFQEAYISKIPLKEWWEVEIGNKLS